MSIAVSARRTPAAALRAAPVTIPCALALGVAAWWALDAGGFAVRLWAPGSLLVLGLVVVAALAVPNAWRAVPRPVVVATAALAGYTAWSFASIAWADDPGYALEGATRTLLYLLAFALFALWPQRGATAGALVRLWLGLSALVGVVLAVRLATDPSPVHLFNFERLRSPTGYPNATACLLMMPVLPAVVLAAAREVGWPVRALAAAAAVLLASLTVLTESRGATFGTPIAVVGLLVLLPHRTRHFYAIGLVAAGVAVSAPALLDVGDVVFEDGTGALDTALTRVALAALAVAAVTAVVALLEGRARADGPATRRIALGARALAVALVLAGAVGGLVALGDPVDRLDRGWQSFKSSYAENDAEANRLVGGLGSARYDFYRVGLRAFRDHPLLGVGADNYYQQYLREGDSAETPRYPHSVEVRALTQTGAIGAALLLAAFGAALWAALRAMRTGGRRRRTAAAAATTAWLFWLVHGSVDWFFEWPGLGLPAFALLGLAAGLAPRADVAPRPRRGPRPAPPRWVPRAAVLGVALLLALPFTVLWTADHEQREAAAVFARDAPAAFAHLERAARLNPLSAAPETLAGSIALRLGQLPRADAAFARALERVPGDQYATLERGAIASAAGRRAEALQLLGRAAALAPRDALAKEALRIAREGGRIDVGELNRRIFEAADQLTS